jgi:hypothetical protein
MLVVFVERALEDAGNMTFFLEAARDLADRVVREAEELAATARRAPASVGPPQWVCALSPNNREQLRTPHPRPVEQSVAPKIAQLAGPQTRADGHVRLTQEPRRDCESARAATIPPIAPNRCPCQEMPT